MSYNEVVKVFDLSSAPTDLREAEDLALLHPIPGEDVSAILTLQVGQFDSQKEGPIYDCITREVTFLEYRLHQWLMDEGAEAGEIVLLRWKRNTQAT